MKRSGAPSSGDLIRARLNSPVSAPHCWGRNTAIVIGTKGIRLEVMLWDGQIGWVPRVEVEVISESR